MLFLGSPAMGAEDSGGITGVGTVFSTNPSNPSRALAPREVPEIDANTIEVSGSCCGSPYNISWDGDAISLAAGQRIIVVVQTAHGTNPKLQANKPDPGSLRVKPAGENNSYEFTVYKATPEGNPEKDGQGITIKLGTGEMGADGILISPLGAIAKMEYYYSFIGTKDKKGDVGASTNMITFTNIIIFINPGGQLF